MPFLRKIFRVAGAGQEPAGAAASDREAPPADDEPARAATDAEARTDEGTDSAAPDVADAAAERPWWNDAAAPAAQPAPVEAAAQDMAAMAAQAADAPVQHEAHDTPPKPDTAPLAELPDAQPDQPVSSAGASVPAVKQGLAAAALRDIGLVRAMNQDSVFALLTTLPREGNDLPLGLFVVADGMGGHDGGEIASRMAISTVVQHVLANLVVPALFDGATEALQPLMVSAIQAANQAIWEHAQAIGSDMGTTCTAALLLGRTLYISHVGDSRLYLQRPDGLHLLTSDHSAVGRLIAVGQLDPSAAREHPLRSQLYRTVGQGANLQVDFVYQPVGNASHVLLCSDGLWGLVDDDVLSDVLTRHVWPQNACREFIARANAAGGDDNISAIVVTLPIAQEEQE
jgi:serine/threonine protein phosphatase PrpC